MQNFLNSKYYGTMQSMLVESRDVEPRIWKANYNLYAIFDCAQRAGAPNPLPPTVQGSTAFSH